MAFARRATGDSTLASCFSEKAAISRRMSQRSASCTRCSPSSRTSMAWPPRTDGSASAFTGRVVRARSRNRFTIAFWRLLIRSIRFYYYFVRWGPFPIPQLTARSRSPSATSLRRSLAGLPRFISANMPDVKARLLKKFEDEIQQLDKELKTELPREIKRARELGDLRENAEYHAAKERQRLVESRISMLQMRVSQIQLMNLDKIPHGKVGFGSTVTLKDESGQTTVYQLVMPEDANVEDGMISTASPIGRALLNKEEGDEIVVKRPDGTERHFELVKLVTIHDG